MQKILITGFCTQDSIQGETFFGGAAGGITLNLASLDIPVGILSVLGSDNFSKKYFQELKKRKVNTQLLTFSNFPISQLRVIHDNDREQGREFKDFGNRYVVADLTPHATLLQQFDFLHVVNTPKLLADHLANNFVGKISYCPGAFLVRDADSLSLFLLHKTNYVFCNEEEFEVLQTKYNVKKLLSENLELICITKAKHGIDMLTRYEEIHIPAVPVKLVDTTGAGDAVVTGFIKELYKGNSLQHAVTEGARLASVVIQKRGTAI